MKKIVLGKRLSLNKEKLILLNEAQLTHFLGGRMAATTFYTSGNGNCSVNNTACCSSGVSACCG